MDTPMRRSRRLEGLRPLSPETPKSVLRVKRALVEMESNPEETTEPEAPRNLGQPGLGSPSHQPEKTPGSPSQQQCATWKPPQKRPGQRPQSPQRQPDPSMESPPGQPEPSPIPGPDPARREPKPKEQPPARCERRQEAGSEPAPGPPRHQLPPGPESPEPCPAQQAPGPEPSGPLRELTRQSPGPPPGQPEPRKPTPTRDAATGDKKRKGAADQVPAAKQLKKDELPVIPMGKPKSGRVWKDRSKKRFSHMVQDKPLRTSWQRKMKERQEKKLVKEFARHLEEEKARRREEKKQRRAENLKRRLANEQRAEVVQVIRNPAKLKRAKKRQLRSVQKRDTLFALQKQPPQQLQAELGPPRGASGATGQGPP